MCSLPVKINWIKPHISSFFDFINNVILKCGGLDDEKNEEHFQNGWFYQDRKNV